MLGVQAGADGLEVVSVEGDVDAAVVGPDGDGATGVGRSEPDRLAAGEAEVPARWNPELNLDRGR